MSFPAEHLKVNPWGETPALILEDGTCLSETTAICRYLDEAYPGRKVMGETALEKATDQQWDMRVWVHCLYRLTVAFHVKHEGLGHALELTSNPQWGEHCRKEAIATAGMLDKHLSDGRQWLAGGNEPGACHAMQDWLGLMIVCRPRRHYSVHGHCLREMGSNED